MPTELDLFSSYAGLLSFACFCIYSGAHSSLPVSFSSVTQPNSASKRLNTRMQNPKKRTETEKNDTESEDEDEDERLSLGDAWLFPIVLSAHICARGLSSDPVIDWICGAFWFVLGHQIFREGVDQLDIGLVLFNCWVRSDITGENKLRVVFLVLDEVYAPSSPQSISHTTFLELSAGMVSNVSLSTSRKGAQISFH